MKIGIIFDLDGTLIDIRKRYYISLKRALEDVNIKLKDLTKQEILKMRKSGKTSKEIFTQIAKNKRHYKKFNKRRNFWFENDELLEFDKPFPFVKDTLKKLKKDGFLLSISSIKIYPSKVRKLLDRFDLLKFFDSIVANNQPNLSKKEVKVKQYRKIIKLLSLDPKLVFVVGDCRVDIEAGEKLDLVTVGVLSGMENKEVLMESNPKFIVKNVSFLRSIIKKSI